MCVIHIMNEIELRKDRYYDLKTKIRESWFAMGEALREIHSRKLYEIEFESFESFCRNTLDMSRQRAHQLIGAVSVVEGVAELIGEGETISLPESEYAARPLVGLDSEAAAEVWQRASEKNERPTHDDVRAERAAYEMEIEEESGQDHAPALDKYRERPQVVPPATTADDRLTPEAVKDLAHFALGGVTLDPCADATNYIEATTAWSEAGLERDWFGSVFCAPPPSQVTAWIRKAVAEEKAGNADAVLLFLPARTWEDWNAYIRTFPRCYLRGIPDVQPKAREGFMLVLIGGDSDAFYDNFASEGDCYIYTT